MPIINKTKIRTFPPHQHQKLKPWSKSSKSYEVCFLFSAPNKGTYRSDVSNFSPNVKQNGIRADNPFKCPRLITLRICCDIKIILCGIQVYIDWHSFSDVRDFIFWAMPLVNEIVSFKLPILYGLSQSTVKTCCMEGVLNSLGSDTW